MITAVQKAVLDTWELAAAFILFSRNFLKWAQLFSCASSFMKGRNASKVTKSHSLEISTVSRHFVKLTCPFSSLPFSAEDGPGSVPS
jgi:hypothetical protein